MAEYDILKITGLSSDYLYVLERVYGSGKLRFDLGNADDHYYIDLPGDTVNFDADQNNNIDFNIKSMEVDVNDEEATILISAGTYTSSSADSPAYCGDGICQSGESQFTCPVDCGTTTTTPTAASPYTPPGAPSPGVTPTPGTTVVTDEPTNMILWIIIGALVVIILVIVILTVMKPKSKTKGYSSPSGAPPVQQQSAPEEGKYNW
jgi:hypothetical protein